MRVAIPVWNGRISPVFDAARNVVIADVEGGRRVLTSEARLPEGIPQMRVRSMAAIGAEVLICGGISRELAAMLQYSGIRVIPGMSGEVGEILDAFISGKIPSQNYFMPGWRGWRRGRGCAHRGGRQWGAPFASGDDERGFRNRRR
ncbi:MAG: NifB/NifX family molybdenum-iron cluster-binding protein [bacterium]|nr:NifB/NifX family molybdenum-iron cluster-binding protein [bacterium]